MSEEIKQVWKASSEEMRDAGIPESYIEQVERQRAEPRHILDTQVFKTLCGLPYEAGIGLNYICVAVVQYNSQNSWHCEACWEVVYALRDVGVMI